MKRRIFLLSPAHCGGERARLVFNPAARFDLAMRLRAGGVPLGEVFAFLSGLYFRGKLAYAEGVTTSIVSVDVVQSPVDRYATFLATDTAWSPNRS